MSQDNLIQERNNLIKSFLLFSRVAPFVASLISSLVITKVFIKTDDIISFEFVVIFIGLYMILYVFISNTKHLCEKLAICNQKLQSQEEK